MGELCKFHIWWLFRQKSPWTGEKRINTISPATMCWVYWIYHQYSTKKEPISMNSKFSFSPHRSQTVKAMISVSPLAILALEISSFALFGQLCILYAPPGILLQMLSSQPIKIWSKVQYSQCKFSRPVIKCQRGREGVLCGAEQSVSDLLSTHSMHNDLRGPASNEAQNHHLLMQVPDWGALLGLLNYFLF